MAPNVWRDRKMLCQTFQLGSQERFLEWLGSEHFKPYYEELHAALQQIKEREGKFTPPNDLGTVHRALVRGETANGPRLFGLKPKKHLFTVRDHYAWFLKCVMDDNEGDPDGVFYSRYLSTERKLEITWQILLRVRHETSTSRTAAKSKESLALGLRQPTDRESAEEVAKQAKRQKQEAEQSENVASKQNQLAVQPQVTAGQSDAQIDADLMARAAAIGKL